MKTYLIKPLIDSISMGLKKIHLYNIDLLRFYVVNDYFNLANYTELKVVIAK